MDGGTPPLLSGSTTRLDCVVDMLDTLLLQSRAPGTETETDRGAELSPGGGLVAPRNTLVSNRSGNKPDTFDDARLFRRYLCDHSEDKLCVPGVSGPTGNEVVSSVECLVTQASTVNHPSCDRVDAEFAARGDLTKSLPATSVRHTITITAATAMEDQALSPQSPELLLTAAPDTLSPLPGTAPGPLSDPLPDPLSELSARSADSGVSETPTDTEPSSALDMSTTGDSPLSGAGDSTGDEARALPEYWRPAGGGGGGGGSRRGPRWRAAELRPRPLSTISTASSSSSGAGSLPRALVRRRPRLGGEEGGEDVIATGTRFSYLSSSGTSISSPPANPLCVDACLTQADRVVAEIVQTEAVYVNDLHEVIEGYLLYWRDNPNPAITDEHKETLFGNYRQIYHCNREFLSSLELCDLDPLRVAECFVCHQHRFVVYTEYCTQYPRAMAMLTELMRGGTTTARLFRERQTALCHTLPLGSYLLKPVQRILKYHLLLQSLMTHSVASPEADRAATAAALRTMRDLAGHIDEMKRRHESAVRVQEVQSLVRLWQGDDLTTFGELLAEETFRVPRARMPRHVFLFEKMLLITKKRDDGTLVYKTHIMCSNLMLIESVPGEVTTLQVLPFDDPRQQYTLQARSVDCKRQWALRLKSAILESYGVDIPKHARELVMKLGQHRENGEGLRRKIGKRHHSVPAYLERRRTVKRAASAASAVQGGHPSRQETAEEQEGAPQRGRRPGDGVSRWSVPSDPLPTGRGPGNEDAPWPPPGAPALPDVDEEGPDDASSDARRASHASSAANTALEDDEAAAEDLQTIVEQLVMQNKHFQRILERPRREVRRSPTSSSDSPSERSERSEREADTMDTDSCLDELGAAAPASRETALTDSESGEVEAPSPAPEQLQPLASVGGLCQEPDAGSSADAAAPVYDEPAATYVSPPSDAAQTSTGRLPSVDPDTDPRPVSAITIENHDNVEYVSLFDYGARPPSAAAVPTAPVADSAGSTKTGLERSVSEPCRRVARRLTRLHQAGQTEVRHMISGIRSRSARLSRNLEDERRVKEEGDEAGYRRSDKAASSEQQRATWYCEFADLDQLPAEERPKFADLDQLPAEERPKRREVKSSGSFRAMMRRSGAMASGQSRWRPLSQLFETTKSRNRAQLAPEVHAVSLQRLPTTAQQWDNSVNPCARLDPTSSRPSPPDLPGVSSRPSVTSLPAAEDHKFLPAPLEDGVRRLRQRLAGLVLGAPSEAQPPASDALGARLASSELLHSPLLVGERRCPMIRGSVISMTSQVSESSSSDSDSEADDCGNSGFYELGMDILEDVRVEVCW